jgi:hypothetical protein
MEGRGVIAELASSNRVTQWAYSQTEGAGGLTWLRADEMVPPITHESLSSGCELPDSAVLEAAVAGVPRHRLEVVGSGRG